MRAGVLDTAAMWGDVDQEFQSAFVRAGVLDKKTTRAQKIAQFQSAFMRAGVLDFIVSTIKFGELCFNPRSCGQAS